MRGAMPDDHEWSAHCGVESPRLQNKGRRASGFLAKGRMTDSMQNPDIYNKFGRFPQQACSSCFKSYGLVV